MATAGVLFILLLVTNVLETVRLLMVHGANLNAEDRRGKKPIELLLLKCRKEMKQINYSRRTQTPYRRYAGQVGSWALKTL